MKWEYKLIPKYGFNESIEKPFDKLGKEGWEYSGVLTTEVAEFLVFKRPVKKG